MFCKNCGAENPETNNNCSRCGASLTNDGEKVKVKRKKLKWWHILLIILAVFVVFGIAGGSEDEGTTNTDSAPNTISSKAESTESKEEKSEYKMGETLDANGLKITMQKAEKWKSDNQFINPEEGNMFIRVYFTIENQSGGDKTLGSFDFDCYADSTQADMSLYGDNRLSFDTISNGRKLEGYIYYEVPENANNIEIEYETSWWSSKKAIFKVEL